MSGERIEAEFTVPASTSVTASNSGGGATSVTLTAGAAFHSELVTDLQTQLNSLRAPSSGSWTVTASSGIVSIGCTGTAAIPSFSLDWPSTAVRQMFGFTKNINYPTTAAELAAAVGYGTWTSGSAWRCNEASGGLAPVFGAVTLAASSTPTYSNQGPRGGPDKAVGFDSTSDAFSGGDVFDPELLDLALLFVGKITATTNVDFFGKGWSASDGFVFVNEAANGLRMYVNDGAVSTSSTAASLPTDQWFVAMAVLDRSVNQLRVGWQSLSSGTQTLGTAVSIATVGAMSSAGNFTMGASGAYESTAGTFQCAYAAVVQGSGVATGMSANLGTAISNFAATFGTTTGTQIAKGVWYSGCNLVADSDPKQAPTGDDKAASISPTGRTYFMASSEFYRHRNVRFPAVGSSLVWSNNAATVGADWETFYLDTQLKHHTWFDVGSKVKVYWDNAGTATELGSGDVGSWTMPRCVTLDELRFAHGSWTGLVEINLGDLYSDG